MIFSLMKIKTLRRKVIFLKKKLFRTQISQTNTATYPLLFHKQVSQPFEVTDTIFYQKMDD